MDNVLVAVRTRPLSLSESSAGCKNIVTKPNNSPQIIVNSSKQEVFTFNYAFSQDDSQEMVYANAVKPIVKRIFEGYNATILAYGQTGSGKTHTMGTTFDGTMNEDIGVIPRAVTEIFDTIDNMPDYNCNVSCSFMELYQEQLYDLLATTSREQSVVDIREDNARGIFVSNLLEVPVGCVSEAIQCLIKGSAGRAVGATAMNATSSRSHAIFTINIQKTNILNSGDSTTSAKFHLVDLAGSERSKKTKATGCRFKEGVKINQGLLALGNVISALAPGQSPFISYRDSKLTRLLQDSLGGNSLTLMIACISPADYNFEETLSTLRYADRARKIKNKPIVNFDPKTAEINRLNAKIQELRMKLLNRNDPDWRKVDEEYLTNDQFRNEKQKQLDVLTKELNKKDDLFKELKKHFDMSINDITALNLKLGILESSHDEILTKMTSVQSKIKDIDSFFESDGPLDITAGRAISVDLQDIVADVMKHLKQSIFDSSIVSCDSTTDDIDDKECQAKSEVFQKQQIGYQENLRGIQKELAVKTRLHNRLNINFENYYAFEEGLSKSAENTSQDYEAVIRKLEVEKEELKKIVDSKNTVNSKKLSEDRRKRVHELELEIAEMKKKNARQEALLKQREKDRIKITDMQRDIHIIKQKKVQLIRAMRLESEAFRKWKLSSSKEVTRLQEKDRRRDGEMRKKQELHERQRNALKRKVDEALQSNKRLQEALQKNTIAQAQRSKTITGGVRTQYIHNWLENEIEVFYSVVGAKHSLEQLIDDRGEMNMRLLQMKKSKSSGTDDHEVMAILQEDIEMRTAQIADLQDKIKSSDLENKVKSICSSLSSIPDAKIIIKYLLENLIDLRRQFEIKAMQLTDIRIAQGTYEQQLSCNDAEWNERYGKISRELEQLRQDKIQVENEYEEKVTILLQELQTRGKCMQNEEVVLRIFEETLASFRNKTMEYKNWMQENNAEVTNGMKIEPLYSSDEHEESFGQQKTPISSSDEYDEDFKIPKIPAAKQLHYSGTELNKTVTLNTTVTTNDTLPLNETVTLNTTVATNDTLPLNETVTLNSVFSDTSSSNNISYKRIIEDTRTDFQCAHKLQKLSDAELINMTITQYPYNEQKKIKPLLDLDYSVQ